MEQLFLQQKYLSFVSGQLSMFKQKGATLWNCRCPYCGDSDKSKTKARGYVYRNKDGLLSYQCHNCGENHKFETFLRFMNKRLYDEYTLETLKGDDTAELADIMRLPEPVEGGIAKKAWQAKLTPVEELSRIHPVREYLKSRKIPKSKLSKFWYAANFREFVQSLGLDQVVPADPRLILVETNKDGELVLMIARAIQASELRYVTIKVDETAPKLFGLHDLDLSKPVCVVEGAIDSLFIPNAIATLDANLMAYKQWDLGIRNAIHIWDNEARSVNTCRRIEQAINAGERVVIFPSDIEEKDINAMVLAGINVLKVIGSRVFKGVQAMLEFSKWKRVASQPKVWKGKRTATTKAVRGPWIR